MIGLVLVPIKLQPDALAKTPAAALRREANGKPERNQTPAFNASR